MATIEKLLTMGLAHGIDTTKMLLATLGSGPAIDRLTWEEVTQAVGTLAPELRAALYVKCAPELMTGSELAALTNRALRAVMRHDDLRNVHRYEDKASGRAFELQAAIVRVALQEHIDPCTCRRCRGEGKVLDHVEGRGMVPGTCGKCEGHGWIEWSTSRRVRETGARKSDWIPRFEGGYRAALGAYRDATREAATGFKTVLFGATVFVGDEQPGKRIEDRLQAGC